MRNFMSKDYEERIKKAKELIANAQREVENF